MSAYKQKVKHILPAFIFISVITNIALLIARYLLDIRYDVLDLNAMVWGFWIPIVTAALLAFIVLAKRTRILNYKKNENGIFGIQVVFWLTASASFCIAQEYLSTATGKLQQVNTVYDIEKNEKSKYYQIDHFKVAPYWGGAHTDFKVSGRHNDDFDMTIYFCHPIIDTDSNEVLQTKYWYGVSFYKSISNRLDDEEKQERYIEFYKECISKIDAYNFYDLDHFERLDKSRKEEGFLKAVEARTGEPPGKGLVILEPIKESYASRNGTKPYWLAGSFAAGVLLLLILIAYPKLDEEELQRQQQGKPSQHTEEWKEMLLYLIPRNDHFITSILLNLNIILFLVVTFGGVDMMSPSAKKLLEFGAVNRTTVMNGDWWRLFTNTFLHAGLYHIIYNIFGIVLAGIAVEPILGRKRFVVLYVLAALGGSIASIWWYPDAISVGASGAILGCFGAIMVLAFTPVFETGGRVLMLMIYGGFAGLTILFGFIVPNVDNAAHIGGLLTGAVVALFMYLFSKESMHE